LVTAAKAVLVASTRALPDVLGAATAYVRPDGVKVGTGAEIIQALGTNIAPATIESAVTEDGGGNFVHTQILWTGLSYPSTTGGETCRDWTSPSSTDLGSAGDLASAWVNAGSTGTHRCDMNVSGAPYVYLQCAEQ
jgi:hypothetical protein